MSSYRLFLGRKTEENVLTWKIKTGVETRKPIYRVIDSFLCREKVRKRFNLGNEDRTGERRRPDISSFRLLQRLFQF